ncbi:two-component system phosphate regulon response regulator PhoB [Novosphingobium kunmingense]|uniref:Two-component system phosphate regulon response regulator PhoB n=1 Tax=Novosphingobium kunmingense TaxID=1211806 RepID=A0A2N0I116_9SPHN|nr:response regulator transcription factor [Novosphingobium kunmingense]PKB24880.1 two-component system phosphate regulon response regulator PhoB [Novosphingobium kunmingense]
MTSPTTILLTAPSPLLVDDLRNQRPDWLVVPLSDIVPDSLAGELWAFIDWVCPTMSGLEMCRRLREAEPTRRSHLTMVLDDPDPDARRRALQAGADDYIVGTLDAAQVIQRVDRKTGGPQPVRQRFVNGPVAIDVSAHQVRVNGTIVALRPNEFRLLAHFMEYPDQVFSRTALIDRLGKDGDALDERTVDVWVGRLRRALTEHGAPDPLRTVRSLGYVMDSQES